jgi:acyl phosphate:glycerol-3-phosphate acyltransferase
MEFFLVFIAYLTGSIPFGILFGKLKGIDIRKSGSGNIGATNASRLLGKKIGFLTLIADCLKAIAPIVLADWLLAGQDNQDVWLWLCGISAFCGHLFPVYLQFKGGKGVATALGVFLYFAPLAILPDVLFFVLIVYITGYVSVGSLIAAAIMPVLIYFFQYPENYVYFSLGLSSLIWIKHYENIIRLLKGQEKSWKKEN